MKNIKYLFLDVGDTLLRMKVPPGKIYLDVLQKHNLIHPGTTDQDLKKIFSDVWLEMNLKPNPDYKDRYSLHPSGNDGWWIELIDLFLTRTRNGNKVSLARNIYFEIFEKFENPDLWDVESTFSSVLSKTKDLGIGLGIISNWDLRLRKLLNDKGLLELFHPVIISAEFGYEKPSPKIFERAEGLTGLKPDNLLYIGDKFDLDYKPPKDRGWHAFLLGPGAEGAQGIEHLEDVFQFIT